MAKIKQITAREIVDSRNNPTLSVRVTLDTGKTGEANIPKGKSTGAYEASELRDKDGHVSGAINNVEKMIQPELLGHDPLKQREIDGVMIKLDDTQNKSNLGANSILGVSLAVSRAAASEANLPLYKYLTQLLGRSDIRTIPTPMFNFINGGAHGNNNLLFQEYLIIPHHFPKYTQKLLAGQRIFAALKQILTEMDFHADLGDEGGFIPVLNDNQQGLELLEESVLRAGFEKKDIDLGLDVAASEFYKDDHYQFEGTVMESDQMIDIYEGLMKKYPLKSLEDGLAEDDWTGWNQLTMQLGSKSLIIGDDLFTTNPLRLQRGIKENSANAILVKPNQIGTLSETLEVIETAKKANWSVIISHRSGETNDSYIADLAVAAQAEYLKSGSISQPCRMAKYNRLADIEKEIELRA